MKEPQKPTRKHHFLNEFEKQSIFYKTYTHPDLYDDLRQDIEEDEDLSDEDKEKALKDFDENNEEWWYDNEIVSLQELIDKLPPNTNLSQVFISNKRDRNITDISIAVYIKTPTNKEIWQKEEDIIKADYDKRYQEYLVEKSKYDEWKAEQELIAAQKNLTS